MLENRSDRKGIFRTCNLVYMDTAMWIRSQTIAAMCLRYTRGRRTHRHGLHCDDAFGLFARILATFYTFLYTYWTCWIQSQFMHHTTKSPAFYKPDPGPDPVVPTSAFSPGLSAKHVAIFLPRKPASANIDLRTAFRAATASLAGTSTYSRPRPHPMIGASFVTRPGDCPFRCTAGRPGYGQGWRDITGRSISLLHAP